MQRLQESIFQPQGRSFLRGINLKKKYGKRYVLKGIDIFFEKGKVTGLLGPNGAGKTTTFLIVTGIVNPNEGNVFYNESDITFAPVYKRAKMGIGYLPQEPSIFRNLTVRDNLRLVLQENNYKNVNDVCDEILEDLNLIKFSNAQANFLSGGEKRRLEVARMLAFNPQFFLLDEPFVGIDPITIKEIQSIIVSLKKRGMGIVVTDHTVDAVLDIADLLYVIYDGEIIFYGDKEKFLTNKKVKEVFLGE
jgi:lipopolysaccharide export system ATP-binding protein